MATTFGVIMDHSNGDAPFKIEDNPVGAIQPPKWLSSWRFETEYIAMLALNLCMSMITSRVHADDPNQMTSRPYQVNQNEFRMVFQSTLRIARIKSAWAE